VKGLTSDLCGTSKPDSLRPGYLPEGWTEHVNPEGARYYVKITGSLCIVTDVSLRNENICEKLKTAVSRIFSLVEAIEFKLPKDCELYIHVKEESVACSYYFIDHTSRTEFWLQNIDSSALWMPPLASVGHLKLVLREHYWTHVEYFPHRPVAPRHCQELVDILRHAVIDQLTSESSTFPYGADQCTKFLNLIDGRAADSPYMTGVIARLWVTISQHRFSHYHGEEHARLGRFQRRLEQSPEPRSIIVSLCAKLLFRVPEKITEELDMLFIDRMAYAMHWQKFMHAQKCTWRESSYLSSGLIVANAGLTSLCRGDIAQCFGLTATAVSLGALASSVGLLHRYAQGEEMNAATAAQHLSEVEHFELGFKPIAIIYSLPRALLFWSLFLFALNILVMAVDIPGLLIKVVVTALLATASVVSFKIYGVLNG